MMDQDFIVTLCFDSEKMRALAGAFAESFLVPCCGRRQKTSTFIALEGACQSGKSFFAKAVQAGWRAAHGLSARDPHLESDPFRLDLGALTIPPRYLDPPDWAMRRAVHARLRLWNGRMPPLTIPKGRVVMVEHAPLPLVARSCVGVVMGRLDRPAVDSQFLRLRAALFDGLAPAPFPDLVQDDKARRAFMAAQSARARLLPQMRQMASLLMNGGWGVYAKNHRAISIIRLADHPRMRQAFAVFRNKALDLGKT